MKNVDVNVIDNEKMSLGGLQMTKQFTGTIYKKTNAREKVSYAYLQCEDVKVDVIAFPATQASLCRQLAKLEVGDSVTLEGNVQTNEKSRYAVQLILTAIDNVNGTLDTQSLIEKLDAELEEIDQKIQRNGHYWLNTNARFHPAGRERLETECTALVKRQSAILAQLRKIDPQPYDSEVSF